VKAGTVSVVPAGAPQAALLSAMHAACFDEIWNEAAMQTMLAQPGVFARIALFEDEPAGFCLCSMAAEECEVLSCGVIPAFRGRGIGRVMVGRAVAEATSRGACRVFLEVAESNEAGRRLYAGLGLRAVGRRRCYYRRPDGESEDALILRLCP
jgi:ribosomal-protein-alanine N-acetyltransferase